MNSAVTSRPAGLSIWRTRFNIQDVHTRSQISQSSCVSSKQYHVTQTLSTHFWTRLMACIKCEVLSSMLSRLRPLLPLDGSSFGASANWTYTPLSELSRRWLATSETGKWTAKDRVTLNNLRKSGKTDEEIASLLGRSVASVKWAFPCLKRRAWSEEELCELDALIAQKVSNRVMADALGRSIHSVKSARLGRSRTASEGQRAGRPYARPKTVQQNWSEDESLKLLELRRGGASIAGR